jgi:hypothetical protein
LRSFFWASQIERERLWIGVNWKQYALDLVTVSPLFCGRDRNTQCIYPLPQKVITPFPPFSDPERIYPLSSSAVRRSQGGTSLFRCEKEDWWLCENQTEGIRKSKCFSWFEFRMPHRILRIDFSVSSKGKIAFYMLT